jgi:hypothetical protein
MMVQDETLIHLDDGESVAVVATSGVVGEALAHPVVGQQSFDVGEHDVWEPAEIDAEIDDELDDDEARPGDGGLDDDPAWGVPTWEAES